MSGTGCYVGHMPTYTYLLQIQPLNGTNWATLLEPRTRTLADGTIGTVTAEPAELDEFALNLTKAYADTGLRRRVVFFEGNRLNEKLYTKDVFCIINDDGDRVDSELTARPEPPAERTLPGCPHAPHDGSCGHRGSCQFAHPGTSCDAVQPVCPSCFTEVQLAAVEEIVDLIQQAGDVVLRCTACEKTSFRYSADLICSTCHWLVPDVNERLEDRFTQNGGSFAPPPGQCPGCGNQAVALRNARVPLQCPSCARAFVIPLDGVRPGTVLSVMCSHDGCSQVLNVPVTIWCPECGNNLRSMRKVRELILAENDPSARVTKLEDVREDEATKVARRLTELTATASRRYSALAPEQGRLLLNSRHLADLVAAGETGEEWIAGMVEVRGTGQRLYDSGGMRAMRAVFQRIEELSGEYPNMTRHIDIVWDGIGDWMG
jgi:hypothetical protein